jgi:uncharacterized protein
MRATDFGPVTGVPTAVPAFVGYTEKAEISGEPAFLRPVEIQSLADFEGTFGGASSFSFHLYNSLRLFFANGGGAAFVVSVGDFYAGPRLEDLQQGLAILEGQSGPTLLAVPDGVLLPRADYATLLQNVLAHCARLRDRFVILDVQGGDAADPGEDEVRRLLADFRSDLGESHDDEESFGAAYFPFLRVTASTGEEVVVPASGAVAGVLSRVDGAKGVWHAPANVALTGVVRPAVRIDNRQQDDFAATSEGKAVNPIRDFPAAAPRSGAPGRSAAIPNTATSRSAVPSSTSSSRSRIGWISSPPRPTTTRPGARWSRTSPISCTASGPRAGSRELLPSRPTASPPPRRRKISTTAS